MEQQEVCAAVEQYGSTVYRLALAQTHSQADADDVYQEVFLRYVRCSGFCHRRAPESVAAAGDNQLL